MSTRPRSLEHRLAVDEVDANVNPRLTSPREVDVSSVPELTDAQQRVIERLHEGKYAAAIADEVNVTRQAVSKHVRKLEEKGLITEHAGETAFYRRSLGQGTSVKIYGLTDAGLEALREAQGLGPGETPRTPSTGLTEPPPGAV